METAQCPVCGQDDVKVRKDQTLYAHQADGARCEGSGLNPADAADAAAGAPQDQVPVPEHDEPASDEPASDEPASDGPAPETASTRGSGFQWQVTVKAPCPYLDDAAWHQANAQLAIKHATRAGHTATGEPAHVDTEHGRDTVTLTYTVPIQ